MIYQSKTSFSRRFSSGRDMLIWLSRIASERSEPDSFAEAWDKTDKTFLLFRMAHAYRWAADKLVRFFDF